MTTSTRNASAVQEVRPWLLTAGVVLLLIAGQVAIEYVSIRGKPLSVAVIDVSRQRLFGQEFIRQVRRVADSPQADGTVRLRQAVESLQQSRDALAAYDFEHALHGPALAEVDARRRTVLEILNRVLDYAQPGIVDAPVTKVPEALGDELLRAQENLLGSLAARVQAADRDLTFWRRVFEIANVLLLTFVLALGLRQSFRKREREARTLRSERQALHESNTLLLELYNQSPVMLYSIDAGARIVRANDAWLGRMGYSLEDVVGRETRDFMTAGKRVQLTAACGDQPLHPDLLQHGFVTNLKIHFETATGETLYASVSAQLVRDDAGEPHGAHCIIIDETEHTLAVKDLDRARARLFDTFATMPVPMFHMDPDGRFLRANAATLRAFGVDDIAALNELGHEDLFAVAAHRVINNSTGIMTGEPHFLVDARGRGLEVQLNLRLIDDRDEPFLEGVFVDVTNLETARRAASVSREHYRRLYDATPVMMCSVDTQGRIAHVNRYWLGRMGYHADEVLNRNYLEFVAADAESKRELEQAVNESLTEFMRPLQLMTRSGEILQGEIHGAPLRNRSGKLESVMCSFLDKTAEKAAERDRDRFAEELATAQKLEAIGQLSAGIAHEINTPSQYVSDNLAFLADAIGSVTPLLKALKDTDGRVPADMSALPPSADLDFLLAELPTALEQSQEGIRQIKNIVGAMKDFSHPGEEAMAPTDINRLLRSVVTIARNEWKYVATVDLQLDPELPAVPCVASSVNQAFLNIVVNAAHAISDRRADAPGHDGKITITSRAENGDAVISITDNGTGMDETTRQRVFNPFFTTKPVGRGTGQGLAIAHRIVTVTHSGRITVESELGEGTTFHLAFPLTTIASAENAA